jgi:hypothetical protein
MLKTITKNVFDVVAGLTMIAAVFYLAAITHIVPVPENTLQATPAAAQAVTRLMASAFQG